MIPFESPNPRHVEPENSEDSPDTKQGGEVSRSENMLPFQNVQVPYFDSDSTMLTAISSASAFACAFALLRRSEITQSHHSKRNMEVLVVILMWSIMSYAMQLILRVGGSGYAIDRAAIDLINASILAVAIVWMCTSHFMYFVTSNHGSGAEDGGDDHDSGDDNDSGDDFGEHAVDAADDDDNDKA